MATSLNPVDHGAEAALLSTILIDPDRVDALSLAAEDFSKPLYQDMWRAIQVLHNAGEPIDYVTITDRMRRTQTLEKGDLNQIAKLVEAGIAYHHSEHYAKIVKDLSHRRKLETVGKNLVQMAWNREQEIDTSISRAESMLSGIGNGGTHVAPDGFAQILSQVVSPETEGNERVFSGYGALDGMALGVEAGRYWVMAGTPGTGKTALQVNLASSILRQQENAAVLYVHPEQHETEIATLLITSQTNDLRPARLKVLRTPAQEREKYAHALSYIKGKARDALFGPDFNMDSLTADMTEAELRKIRLASGALQGRILYLDPAGVNVFQLRREFRRARREISRKFGEDTFMVVCLDGLHLLAGAGEGNRHLELTTISRNIKIAAQNDVYPGAILASHQLNYASYNRDMRNHKYSLRDLRDSGSIGQDADVVIFVWRPSVYDLDMECPDKLGPSPGHMWDWLKLISKKNRQTSGLFQVDLWMNKYTIRIVGEQHATMGIRD